jgi:hypothetical protein
MRENTARIAYFERIATHHTINAPAAIVLGITAQDLAAGIFVLIAVASIPSFYAPFVALFLAVSILFGSRHIRRALAPKFFSHLIWSLGVVDTHTRRSRIFDACVRQLLRPSQYPNPFAAKRRRFVSFAP